MSLSRCRTLVCLIALVVSPFRAAGNVSKQGMEQAIAEQYIDLHQCAQKQASMSVSGKLQTVSYLDAIPTSPQGTVVFFHGAQFSARTWQVTGVMDALFAESYRALAMDWKVFTGKREEEFAEAFMKAVSPPVETDSKLVIVAASAGGRVALPYVWTNADMVSGYVSVAGSNGFVQRVHGSKDVPLLTIYGANDPLLKTKDFHKRFFSKWQNLIIPDAPHPCYLKDITAARQFTTWVKDFVTGNDAGEVKILARVNNEQLAPAVVHSDEERPPTLDAQVMEARSDVENGYGFWFLLVVCAGALAMSLLYYGWQHSWSKRYSGILPGTIIGKEDACPSL